MTEVKYTKMSEIMFQEYLEIEIQKMELEKQNKSELEKQKNSELEKIDQRSLLNIIGGNDVMKYSNMNTIFSNDITKSIINALYTELIKNSVNNNSYKQLYKTIEAKNNISYENFNNKNINEKGKLIISNHLNVADTIVILNKIKNKTFTVAINEWFDNTFNKFNVKNTFIEDVIINNILNLIMYKRDKKNGNDVKDQMLTKIQQGNNILIYPEGEYGKKQNKIDPFYPGGIKLAYDNKIPIMPIVLYYSNINHLKQHHSSETLSEKTNSIVLLYQYSGDIIVHHCNGGNDILPNHNETFEEFKQRIHNIMQTELRELNEKHNPNFKPL